jgi:hypothetical protein
MSLSKKLNAIMRNLGNKSTEGGKQRPRKPVYLTKIIEAQPRTQGLSLPEYGWRRETAWDVVAL